MRRIGILGGTFDPPHIGHLVLAEYAADGLDLEHVLFVPAGDPPHKRGRMKTPVEHRLAMLALATSRDARFVLSRIDIDRPGPHYSHDMVKIVQSQYPDAQLYFVMGGDSLKDFPNWESPEILIELCQLAVMRRPPHEHIYPAMHRHMLPQLEARVEMIDAPLLEISSTDIAERLRSGKSVKYIVPELVMEYIYAQRLYKD